METVTGFISQNIYDNFHPRIFDILRNQEDECENLTRTFYARGQIQEQISEALMTFKESITAR